METYKDTKNIIKTGNPKSSGRRGDSDKDESDTVQHLHYGLGEGAEERADRRYSYRKRKKYGQFHTLMI